MLERAGTLVDAEEGPSTDFKFWNDQRNRVLPLCSSTRTIRGIECSSQSSLADPSSGRLPRRASRPSWASPSQPHPAPAAYPKMPAPSHTPWQIPIACACRSEGMAARRQAGRIFSSSADLISQSPPEVRGLSG